MTPLGLLNFLVLQWFGVRLARTSASITLAGTSPWCVGAVVMIAGDAKRWRVVATDDLVVSIECYSLLRWVWPLTGWWSNYRWIARR